MYMETPGRINQLTSQNQIMNILIVDDRPENLLTLESIIERGGRNIIKASGGNEALRLAIRENIGLIMLDIQMPDIDGVEVAGLLRSNNKTRHIPIIFVSAVSKSERPSLKQFEEGTIDCLNKPLDLDETKMKVAFYERLFHITAQKKEVELFAASLSKQLEQFVYIVSHDLKAPLRAIENLTNWISEDLGNCVDSNTNENLLLLRSRVSRMNALLEGILEYSRCGRLSEEMAEVDLNQMIHSIFESLEAPSDYKLITEALPVIKTERTRIYKILYNLIKNSIQHHNKVEQGFIKISYQDYENGFLFSVHDNGPGIKPQYVHQVFELFCTLKSRDEMETTGVGLAVVKKLIDDVSGKIWIESRDDEGTTVKFYFPVKT